MNFRVSSRETNNAISIIDTLMPAGSEDGRHVHEREDQTFIINEGEVIFFIGENVVTACNGDVIFVPRGVAHEFRILTKVCKATVIMTPGNFDQFYWQLSHPFDGNKIPQGEGASPVQQFSERERLLENYGVRFV